MAAVPHAGTEGSGGHRFPAIGGHSALNPIPSDKMHAPTAFPVSRVTICTLQPTIWAQNRA
jgi:hypothetical protein